MSESYPHYDQLVDDLQEALDRLERAESTIAELRTEVEQRRRDMADMYSSPHTVFVRCGCGRIRSQGLVCPTIAEGGTCEHGE